MFYVLFFGFALIFPIFAKCPNGAQSSFSNDGCLFFISTLTAFLVAEKNCNDLGGHLISIHDDITNMYISEQSGVSFKDQTDFWFGANDINTSPNYVWLDNSTMNYNKWDTDEPSTTLPGHNCGAVKIADGKWITDSCNKLKPYVCEVKVSTTTTLPPTTTTSTSTKKVTATIPPLPCVDTIPNCRDYLQLCTNPNYQQLMYKECRKSCNLCNLCLDTDARCPQWQRNGFCTNPFYQTIWNECRKTCNLCK